MKLSRLIREAGYDVPVERIYENIEITGIAFDTRTVKKGNLFVALCGKRIDSHSLLNEAARCGAVAAVTDAERGASETDLRIPCIPLPDTRAALARLSDAFYGHPTEGMTVIGVTGTNGKTSVTYLLSELLERSGRRVGMIGTVMGRSRRRVLNSESGDPEAHMTTPDPPVLYRMLSEMRQDGCDTVVMEATSHASVLKKLDPLTFDLLIFTNLTSEHLDFHETMEAYFEAKASLFRKTKWALINLDGSAVFGDVNGYARRLESIARAHGAETLTCSGDPKKEPDFLLADYEEHFGGETEGITFRMKSKKDGTETVLRSPLLGAYNAMNLLECASASRMLGVPEGEIIKGLRDFSKIPGRMERVPLGDDADIAVFIDFAHTPDALENLLRAVRGFRAGKGRITVLFGCGGDRDPHKRKEMAHIASRMADLIYVTSDNSRSEDPNAIINDILKGIDKEKPCRVILSRRQAIECAVAEARAGDILLLCGKGHERYSIDREGIHAFCEPDIVKTAYARRRAKHKTGTDNGAKE